MTITMWETKPHCQTLQTMQTQRNPNVIGFTCIFSSNQYAVLRNAAKSVENWKQTMSYSKSYWSTCLYRLGTDGHFSGSCASEMANLISHWVALSMQLALLRGIVLKRLMIRISGTDRMVIMYRYNKFSLQTKVPCVMMFAFGTWLASYIRKGLLPEWNIFPLHFLPFPFVCI